ncbi:hypothetical protein ZIOFF_062391 [Zingiber officinale]|uniref:Core Histone H2A/H2B/H3 domain-containing protein n=1 Tax=Zingiber officinale TaxID=94328 RepID=A0A8J5F5F7_ZINOF|nr:hypothetical protein ZIOFF_062391 [Zingiber officinale]
MEQSTFIGMSNLLDDCDMEQQTEQPSTFAFDIGMPLLANFDMTIAKLEQQIQSAGVVSDNTMYQPTAEIRNTTDFNTDMEQQTEQTSVFAFDTGMSTMLANFDMTIEQLEQQIQFVGVQPAGVVSDNTMYQPTAEIRNATDFNIDMEQQTEQTSAFAFDTGMSTMLANFDMTIEQLEQQIQSIGVQPAGVVSDNTMYQPTAEIRNATDFNTDMEQQTEQPSAFVFDTGMVQPAGVVSDNIMYQLTAEIRNATDFNTDMEQQTEQPSAFAFDSSMPTMFANFDMTIEQLEQQIQSAGVQPAGVQPAGVISDNTMSQPTTKIRNATDFKKLCIPITRVKKIIKKIMKSDKNVDMFSDDALVLLAKACEMFF